MKCRECMWMIEVFGTDLYVCANPKSDNFGNYTGVCCEDDCKDGEGLTDDNHTEDA